MRSVLFLAAALVACAHQPEYRGKVSVVSSELIPVDPDVRVVADADKPLFFAAGSYWLFHDASWYRGSSLHGPWVREPQPPWQVRKIDQPYAFTRYRLDHPREQSAVKTETPSKELSAGGSKMFRF